MKNLLIILGLMMSVNVMGQKPSVVPNNKMNSCDQISGQISKLKIFDASELSKIFERADKLAGSYEMTSDTKIEEFIGGIHIDKTTYIFNYVYSSVRKYSYIRITNTENEEVILIFRYNMTFSNNLLTSQLR